MPVYPRLISMIVLPLMFLHRGHFYFSNRKSIKNAIILLMTFTNYFFLIDNIWSL